MPTLFLQEKFCRPARQFTAPIMSPPMYLLNIIWNNIPHDFDQ
jgi:hypothetical protein